MMTFLVIVAVLCALAAAFMVIIVVGSAQAVRDAVADTMRVDAIINDLYTITPAGPEPIWQVSRKGLPVASGPDLRQVLDFADKEIHGHG